QPCIERIEELGNRDVQRAASLGACGEPGARTAQVLLDPLRIAPRLVDERGGELDQALDQLALGEVAGAHPRRLEELVRLEEVAVGVGSESRLERLPPCC